MKDQHSYSAEGKGRAVLEALSEGPAAYADFRQTLSPQWQRKCWYIVQAMRKDGLIRRVGPETYVITEDGEEALAELRAGRDYVCGSAPPTVRIFTKAEVAA